MTGPQVKFVSKSNDAIVDASFANSCVFRRGFRSRIRMEALAGIPKQSYKKLDLFHAYQQDVIDNEHYFPSSNCLTDKHRDLLVKIFECYPNPASSHATTTRSVSTRIAFKIMRNIAAADSVITNITRSQVASNNVTTIINQGCFLQLLEYQIINLYVCSDVYLHA